MANCLLDIHSDKIVTIRWLISSTFGANALNEIVTVFIGVEREYRN